MNFIADDDQLIVNFKGAEKFFAVKSKLVIPREKIISLEWHPEFTFEKRLLRVAGSNIPNVLLAGRFRGGGENYFLYIQHARTPKVLAGNFMAQNILVISTHDFVYRNILLACDPDIGAGLLNWRKEHY